MTRSTENAPAPQFAQDAPMPAPPAAPQRPPIHFFLTMLHLGAYGLLGLATMGLLTGMIAAGFGLMFLLGAGVFVFVGIVYALFGIAWFEMQRVDALYGLGIEPIRLRIHHGAGFRVWVRSLGRQMIDGDMWRGLANFSIASMFGATVFVFFRWFLSATFQFFNPVSLFSMWEFVFAFLSAAGLVGLTFLHRVIAIGIAKAGAKEQRLTEQVRETTEQREGAVRAADVERTRIERDLHDGVQPRLVSVGMTLGLAQEQIDSHPEEAKQLVAEAHTSTKTAITELRQLTRGIYASVLDDRGLDAALSALAVRSHIPVQLDIRLDRRCSRDAEAAVYFAIAESLTNAAKHSRASEARVVVRFRDGNTLWARVEDNGIGGARVVPGGGLDGIMNRVLAAGGASQLDSPQGGPTSLEVKVPCAS